MPRETVWKLRTGPISWSHEAAQRGEIAHFSALRVTDKRLIRPVQILSRQSLETVWKFRTSPTADYQEASKGPTGTASSPLASPSTGAQGYSSDFSDSLRSRILGSSPN